MFFWLYSVYWGEFHLLTLGFVVFLLEFAVNEGMSRKAIHKAMFESAALIGASVLQVYLLQRLFERRLGTSRV